MSIALKVDSNGNLARFGVTDTIQVQDVVARDVNEHMEIGNNLAATYEIILGVSVGVGDTRVKGDLIVEGDATVNVDTVLSGAVQLGDGGGDTIDIGDPANPDSDTINVNSDLLMKGQAIRNQDYTEVSPAALAAQANDYDPTNFGTADILRQDLTGSQTITGFAAPGAGDNERVVVVNIDGAVDVLTLSDENVASAAANRILGPNGNDVALNPGECAMLTYDATSTRWRVIAVSKAASGGDTLQTAYNAGQTISVASNTIGFSNTTDGTDVLTLSGDQAGDLLSMAPSGSGRGIFLNNTGTGSAVEIQDGGTTVLEVTAAGSVDVDPTTGQDFTVNVDGSGASILFSNSGVADTTLLEVNNIGSGNALDVQDGGGSVLVVDGAGAVDITPSINQDLTLTASGTGNVDINSGDEIFLDATNGISIGAGAASDFTTSSGDLTMNAGGELVLESNATSATSLTLSQDSYRSLSQTGAGEVLNGATSLVGAINKLADKMEDVGIEQFVTVTLDTGQTAVAGDALAYSSSGTVRRADASTGSGYQKFEGIARTGGTGVAITMWTPGALCTGSGFTPGAALFVPESVGQPTETPPADTGDLRQRVGWAISATQYVLDPGPPVTM